VSDFNKLWAGQTLSLLGSAVTAFALPSLAILVLHATPIQIGALTALETLPFPVLGLFVGVLADRLPRRNIMIAADAVRFAALASIPVAAAFGVLRLPQLYGVALASGVGSAFFGITYQSYVPVLVAANRLTDANMKLEFSNSGSTMAGSAAAGLLVQWIGAAAAIATDAISYLVSIGTLLLIQKPEPAHQGPPLSVRQYALEMLEGLTIVFKSPDLRWIVGATATTNFGGAMVGAVSLIYAYRILHLQPGLMGVIYGFAEVGFVGALLSGRVRKVLGLRATLMSSLSLGAIGLASMLFARLGAPYAVLFVTSAIVAVSIPIYNVNQVSYRQALIDVRMQGRMNATIRTFVWGTLPLGAVVGGYLGTALGIPATIVAGAVVCAAATLWLIPMRERDPEPVVPHPRESGGVVDYINPGG
jgi:predicted MFS family arabinose efflux permease